MIFVWLNYEQYKTSSSVPFIIAAMRLIQKRSDHLTWVPDSKPVRCVWQNRQHWKKNVLVISHYAAFAFNVLNMKYLTQWTNKSLVLTMKSSKWLGFSSQTLLQVPCLNKNTNLSLITKSTWRSSDNIYPLFSVNTKHMKKPQQEQRLTQMWK